VKADRPSRTAHFVALGRAMADAGFSHVPDFRDPTARVFLTEKGKGSLAKVEQAARGDKRALGFGAAQRMSDLMALRTVAIDGAVREAIAGGATQLVILGAGYDGRGWRMPELAGVKVFEVDHPATQREKQRHLDMLPRATGEVVFVPMDFAGQSLDAALDAAGHNRALPTCWLWEGVVMYLTHDAVRSTLMSIGQRTAPASTLIVNYHTAHRRFFAKLLLRLIGEPQISSWSPEEMAADLRSVGFVVYHDSGMLDWNSRFAQGRGKVERAPYMRVAIARL
jgi:methyltransferase (TIGR00027 family)